MATVAEALAMGIARHKEGRLADAEQIYRDILRLHPDDPETLNNLGFALMDQRRLEEAEIYLRHALRVKPEFPHALSNLGVVLQSQGRFKEAMDSYREALRIKPDLPEALSNLGVALQHQNRHQEAIDCCREALKLRPDYPQAYNNMGDSFVYFRKAPEAIACYREALKLRPGNPKILLSLAHQMQQSCLWNDIEVLSRQVIAHVEKDAVHSASDVLSPFSFLALPVAMTPKQHYLCARQWAGEILKSARPDKRIPPRPHGGSKITLGYLSADFRPHAVAHIIAELFEKHDRARFAVNGYSIGPAEDSPMRQRLIKGFDRFVDLRDTSFTQGAERIAADRVDILVDLTGYTQHARTEILALKPAPIQINYIGYPGTMGADFIDYILADDYIAPMEQQPFFTEKLVHLPGCYQVNTPRREMAERTPTRAECGLPENAFVFCNFNNSYKITPWMFSVWMEILQATPGSVLWLAEVNAQVMGNLLREAQARGVAAEQLVFFPRLPMAEYIVRYRLADLFLDTFPYNGHATASDSLLVGCPVLTLSGETMPSRVAGSLLAACGLPELVTTDRDRYRDAAVHLAKNPAAMAGIRTRLEQNRATSPLFDTARFARNLEKAYEKMWELHASGEKPQAFAVEE